jgi:hypothetical protein
MKPAIPVLLLLWLSACTMAPASVQSELDILRAINGDAIVALADANANGDRIAAACYQAIIAVSAERIQAQQVGGGVGGGLIANFQRVRDLTQIGSSPIGTTLIIGCAPLVQSMKMTMLQFFTNIGAAALLHGIVL